jgi:hypothetical protein
MPFRPTRSPRPHDALQRALRAAVATHRPETLRALVAAHGERACAQALCELSGRAIADALSLLTASQRSAVLCRLPRPARLRLRGTEDPPGHAPHGPSLLLRW